MMEIQAIGIQFLTDEEDDEDKMDMGGHTTTEEAELCGPEQERSLVIRRVVHVQLVVDQPEQRENIIQTKCRVKRELCALIMDGGSMTNAMSKELVEKLNLKAI